MEDIRNLLVKESIVLDKPFKITKKMLEEQLSDLQKRYDSLHNLAASYVLYIGNLKNENKKLKERLNETNN